MEKRNSFEILLGAALLGGGIYFLYYTERGQQLRERLLQTAADKMDEWLGQLEEELAKAEDDILTPEQSATDN